MANNGQNTLDWSRHENEILDLFVTQNKTLKEVMAYMRERHNFKATQVKSLSRRGSHANRAKITSARQYKFRFPKLKNVRSGEWIWITKEMQRRAAVGKRSAAFLHNRLLHPARVTREIARYQSRVSRLIDQASNPSPGRIAVRTPPPTPAVGSDSNVYNPQNLAEMQLEKPILRSAQETALSLPQLEVAFLGERVLELDDIIDLQVQTEASQFDGSQWSDWNFSNHEDFGWLTASHLPRAISGTRALSITAGNSPNPQSEEKISSPWSHYINFDVFDTRHSFQLTANLPWFQLQSMIEQSEPTYLQSHSVLRDAPSSSTLSGVNYAAMHGRDILSYLLTSGPFLGWDKSPVFQPIEQFRHLVPERYDGELSDMLHRIVDPSSTTPSGVSSLFRLIAYLISNNFLREYHKDIFLRWILEHKLSTYLERFTQINVPTIHAFVSQIARSAVRTGSFALLTTLLNRGMQLDSISDELVKIDNPTFLELLLSKVDPAYFQGPMGTTLLHGFIDNGHADLAYLLFRNGVRIDSIANQKMEHALYDAILHRKQSVRHLLALGVNVNKSHEGRGRASTALALAAYENSLYIVTMLLEHGASISGQVDNKDILEWCALHRRNIYSLFNKKMSHHASGVRIRDVVDAAGNGLDALQSYMRYQQWQPSRNQLEQALSESIKADDVNAAMTLLQYGVNPDCPSVDVPPLLTAVTELDDCRTFCNVLMRFKVNPNVPGVLEAVVGYSNPFFLRVLVAYGLSLENEGENALLQAAGNDDIASAAFLIKSGVDIRTPRQKSNPLREAIMHHADNMVSFLVGEGADINAPAHPNHGSTPLQEALKNCNDEIANFLLDEGADASAPPATEGGLTALEAIFYKWCGNNPNLIALVNRLLAAGAPVNRQNDESRSALHGAILCGQENILRQFLRPEHNAILSHMCSEYLRFFGGLYEGPRTPTQLAAGRGQLGCLRLLLDHGADVNEAPADYGGRTALQAATSRNIPEKELIQFLLDRGANVNAEPAIHGGITALQGAAITGCIWLAILLLDKGADVNENPALDDGRYAIEGAAEHGRLDMVQLLLNAGAVGNVIDGTGFQYAIQLAEDNLHFTIANLLREAA